MEIHVVLASLCVLLCIQNGLSEAERSRQKRCIVIQKQSGTHGDSTEGEEDEDYRKPQPKEPKPDKVGYRPMGSKYGDRNYDIEDFSPEPQKFRNRLDRLRLKKLSKYSNSMK